MSIVAIIPARYASSRFPGKPLAMVHGKPMIQRVVEQVMKCLKIQNVVVATDDLRIEQVVKSFGGNVVITSENHPSGTDRCAEALRLLPGSCDYVLNVQGDEPFIQPAQLDLVCSCFTQPEVKIATLVKKISRAEELFSPHVVKVVLNEKRQALYFSRSPVPHHRNALENYWLNLGTYYKHLGIYGFHSATLAEIVQLPVNELEKAESLEQLRWLAHGYAIQTAETDEETIAIDTPEDLQRASKFYREG